MLRARQLWDRIRDLVVSLKSPALRLWHIVAVTAALLFGNVTWEGPAWPRRLNSYRKGLGRKFHYDTTRHTFQIYGTCEECRKRSE